MRGTVVFDFDYTLADTGRFKEAIARSGEEAAIRRMADFVYPGARAVLDRLKASGWTLALLTVGEPEWQRRKVARSGLLTYFDHAVYTAEPKAERLSDMRPWPRPLAFVNDHGGELDAIGRVLPDAMRIALRGPKPLPADPSVPLCENLEEVYNTLVCLSAS